MVTVSRLDRRKSRLYLTGLLALASAAAAAPASALNLKVDDVHVTQGTQTLFSRLDVSPFDGPANGDFGPQAGNLVTLIAHRTTAVRVKVVDKESLAPAGQGVTGRLHIVIDGQRITPVAGLMPMNALDVPLATSGTMRFESETLNFELPYAVQVLLEPKATTGPGFLSTEDVHFSVDISDAGNVDTEPGNDAVDFHGEAPDPVEPLRGNPIKLVRQPVTTVYFSRGRWGTSAEPFPEADFVAAGRGDAFLSAALPLDNSCRACLYRPGLPATVFTNDVDGGPLEINDDDLIQIGETGATEAGDFLRVLDELRPLVVEDRFGPSLTQFLLVWMPEDVLDQHGGAAALGGRTAYAAANPIRGQKSMAHEIVHGLGLVATDFPGEDGGNHWDSSLAGFTRLHPDVGWDVGATLVDNPVENLATRRVKRQDAIDLMTGVGGGASSVRDAWTTLLTARLIIETPALAPDAATPSRPCVGRTASVLARFIPRSLNLAAGIASLRGWTYDWCTRRIVPAASARTAPPDATAAGALAGRFQARALLRSANGTRTVTTDVDPTDMFNTHDVDKPSSARHSAYGGFQVSVALRPGERVEALSVLDTRTRRTIASTRRSAQPPVVRITTPKRGSRLGPSARLSWTATDPDTPRDRLRYQVAYSPDGGNDFVPVAVGARRASIVVAAAQLPRTQPGRGLLRVFVNDGLNTGVAQIGGLSLSRSGFVLSQAVRRP